MLYPLSFKGAEIAVEFVHFIFVPMCCAQQSTVFLEKKNNKRFCCFYFQKKNENHSSIVPILYCAEAQSLYVFCVNAELSPWRQHNMEIIPKKVAKGSQILYGAMAPSGGQIV